MIIRFDGTEIGGNYIAGIVKNAKVYDGVFKLGSTICETYKLSINKDGISSIPQVVTISTNEYTLSGGNHLYIEGATTDDLIDYSVDGATKQSTYTGRNKCPTNLNDWESGDYSGTGVKTTNTARIRLKNLLRVEPSTTYYVNTFSSNDRLAFRAYDNNMTFVRNISSIVNKNTLTTNSDEYYLGVFIYSNTNQSRSYETYQTMFSNGTITPLICLNSETDKAYEQYVGGTPSPNPDYPQDVKTIPSIINLFNLTSITAPSEPTSKSLDNGVVTITWNAGFNVDLNEALSNLDATKSYTISFKHKGEALYLRNRSVGSTNILSTNDDTDYTQYTLTLTNISGFRFRFVRKTTSGTAYIKDFQIEEGSVSHEYVPYGHWSRIKVTGKNILDVNGLNLSNGYYGANGQKYSGNNNGILEFIEVVPNTTYQLSKNTTTQNVGICEFTSVKGFIKRTQITTNTNAISITTTATTKYLAIQYNYDGSTTITRDLISSWQPQLEESEEPTTYEPYKENQVLIDMSKENLNKNPNILDGNYYINYSSNKILTSSNGNKVLYIPITGGKTYTVSKITSDRFSIATTSELPANNVELIDKIENHTATVLTLNTSSTANYLCVYYYRYSDTLTEEEIRNSIKIYESNNPTPYYELCKIGDYKDTLNIDSSGNIVINKNVGKVVLNGGEKGWEQWTSQTFTNTILCGTTILDNIPRIGYVQKSNYFTGQSSTMWATDVEGVTVSDTGTTVLRFRINKTTAGGLNSFKTWLSIHNTDVYYALATPETITLPNATIQLFEGINHITFVDNLDTTTTIVHKTPIKTLYATDYDDKNDFTYEIQTEDAMTKFNFKYDASPIMTHTKTVEGQTINYAYLSEILDDICTKAGVTNGISSFYQDDMEVSWYNDTYMARDYLGFIGEINGKNLCISPRNELVFKVIKTTPTKSINFNNVSDFKIGTEHTITRVVWDNGINKWEYGNETGETYYINTDNVYVIDTSIVEHIYNEINGLDYYNFKTTNCPLDGLKVGDIVRFTDGTNNYDTFTQFNNASFSKDSWFGGIELNVDSEAKQETQVLGQKENIREIKQTLDRTNNTVSTLVTETGEISTAVETLQTNTYTKTQVQRIVDGTGVDGVKVTKVETISGTFDIDGMHYAKSGAETESTINQYGVDVTRTEDDEQLLFAGYDTTLKKAIVTSEHLITRRYLSIGENSRLQDYKTGGGVWVI